MAVTETKLPALRLNLDVEAVKGALVPQAEPGDAAALEKKAQDYVDVLANIQPNADMAQTEAKAAVEFMGRDLQAEAAQRSKMLRQPIKDAVGARHRGRHRRQCAARPQVEGGGAGSGAARPVARLPDPAFSA